MIIPNDDDLKRKVGQICNRSSSDSERKVEKGSEKEVERHNPETESSINHVTRTYAFVAVPAPSPRFDFLTFETHFTAHPKQS